MLSFQDTHIEFLRENKEEGLYELYIPETGEGFVIQKDMMERYLSGACSDRINYLMQNLFARLSLDAIDTRDRSAFENALRARTFKYPR